MKAVREDNDDHDGEGFDGGRHASEEPADDETSLPAPSAADPPLDLPPFRSYNRFRANSRGRFNHLQRLWLKKQIKKSLARDSNADLAALVGELSLRQADDDRGEQADSSLGHHGEGPCVVDPGVVSELRLQVKDELRRNELLAKNRELEKRLRRSDILSYLGRTEYPLEVRVLNFTFEVAAEEDNRAGDLSGGGSDPYRIRTVFNSSFVYPVWLWLSDLWRGGCDGRRRRRRRGRRYTTKRVLDNINLIFEPGKSYLLLGPPGSGRTSLLRAITGILHETDIGATRGAISYNGRTLDNKGEFHIENAFSYIGQLDKHAPRLTVKETFDFAFQCKSGRQLKSSFHGQDTGAHSDLSEEDTPLLQGKSESPEDLTLKLMGLEEVQDSYVSECSGGQYRRVTVGEMLTPRASILCGDEISNGLDATSTYDMVQSLLYVGRFNQLTRIFSLLQPSPETVSLFDEVVVLAEGRLIFAGPVDQVEDYFEGIGYECPSFIDVADFIQLVSSGTEDGRSLYRGPGPGPTIPYLAERFLWSDHGKRILDKLDGPHRYLWKVNDEVSQHGSSYVSPVSFSQHVGRKYANSFARSTALIARRFLTLWIRDRRVIAVSAVKNVVMGLSVGGVFYNSTDPVSIQGALFQALLFVVLGAMQGASALVSERVIFYKHHDANFYSAWPFVFGRALSQIPQTTADTVTFATILYFFIGLGGRTSPANFFVYLSLLLVFAFLMQQQLAVFASFASAGDLIAYNAGVVLFLILFGGFIVPPETIPPFFSWLYWWNPFAWTYRALVVNEFNSGRWDDPGTLLSNAGFNDYSGSPYSHEWIPLSFCYTVPYSLACIVLSGLGLTSRKSSETRPSSGEPRTRDAKNGKGGSRTEVQIPFTPVTMAFRDISYDVKALKADETKRILSNVSGIFRPGRLCALMGSSGSGKSTLCDVLSLRKRTGVVSGSVFLNGWPQENNSFRRCSGYVEQLDVQSPELTVFETILFSARLRLEHDLLGTVDIADYVAEIMGQLELVSLRDALVGTEDEGLSFEQKKRLSIAVELAASPSVIFLDEPTTGLDSRNALVIMRSLRRIADGGRTIVTTIHQPASAVFGLFDDLLLLKNGNSAYFGPIGRRNCSQLVNYFECRGAQSIELGENPANWVLREVDSLNDATAQYKRSNEFAALLVEVDHCVAVPGEKIEYKDKFPASPLQRRLEINRRLRAIYWRSPTYNYSRLLVSLAIAVILGSAFFSKRGTTTFSESEMRARMSVIFLSFVVTGFMAIVSVLPVMTKIRDMFYRHRDALMYDSASMGLALGVAEQGFILFSTLIFSTVFLSVTGVGQRSEPLADRVERAIGFWGFFTFNFAIYSYLGQLFVCLVESTATAIILSSIYMGMNNFFSGLVVRPQYLVGTFYEVAYRITPGHYVYDGLVGCLYSGITTDTVIADTGSEFEDYLMEMTQCVGSGDCSGTVHEFVYVFFGGEYGMNGPTIPCVVLGVVLTITRILTWVALKYIRFG